MIKKIITYFLLLVFPVLYFFRYFFSDYSFSLFIGHDFDYWSYRYKIIALDYLSKGELYWWSISEACGIPFWSNPFAQAFYPPNLIAAFFYKLNGGYTYGDHQKFLILGFSILNFGLFHWLKSLCFKYSTALVVTLTFCMSLRISTPGVFFLPVHTFAWVPFMLWGVTEILEYKKYILGSLITIFSTFCFFAASYSYHLYYSIFLFPLYIFLFSNSKTKKILFNSENRSTFYSYLIVGFSFFIPLVLSYPFLIKFIQTSLISGMRGGTNFNQSLYGSFSNLSEFASAYIFPPGCTPFGWVYFGIGTLCVILTGIMYSVYLAKNGNRIYLKKYLFFGVWILLVSSIGLVNKLPWYDFLWNNLPFFSNFRAWSRISIIVLPIWAILFAMSIELIFDARILNKNKLHVVVIFLLIIFSCFVYHFQSITPVHRIMRVFAIHHDLNQFKSHFHHVSAILIIIYVALFIFTIYNYKIKTSFSINKWKVSILFLFLMFSAFEMQNLGLKYWTTPGFIYERFKEPTLINYNDRVIEQFQENRSIKSGNIYLDGLFSTGTIGGVGFKNYWKVEHLSRRNKDDAMRNRVLGIATNKKIFLSSDNSYAKDDAVSFLADSDFFEGQYGSFEILHFEPERIRIKCSTTKKGILSYIDNWDPDWYATINGEEVDLQLLFTTFKSIPIPKGECEVEFYYAPFRNIFDVSTIREKINWYKEQTK